MSDDERPFAQADEDDDDGPGPAAMVAGEIVRETRAQIALVVLVVCEESGIMGIDVATAQREIPPACAVHHDRITTLITDIRDYAAQRITGQTFGNWHKVTLPFKRGGGD